MSLKCIFYLVETKNPPCVTVYLR